MLFTPKNKKINKLPCLTINNCIIDRITDCKFLGVWFNDKLSWTTQTEHIKSDLSRTIGIIYKTKDLLPTWLKVQIYYTLFYQKLYYCLLVWGTTVKTNYNGLVSLQKRMLRIMTNSNHCSEAESLFDRLNILPLSKLYHYKLGQLIHRNGISGFDLIPANLSEYNLRTTRTYRLPSIRTNYGKQMINFQVSQLLNAVGNNFIITTNRTTFKKSLRSFLIATELIIL